MIFGTSPFGGPSFGSSLFNGTISTAPAIPKSIVVLRSPDNVISVESVTRSIKISSTPDKYINIDTTQ